MRLDDRVIGCAPRQRTRCDALVLPPHLLRDREEAYHTHHDGEREQQRPSTLDGQHIAVRCRSGEREDSLPGIRVKIRARLH